MDRKQLESTFDGQAATYDQQWERLAPFRDGLHLLLTSLFSALPSNARMLCVGAGTGAEIHYFAEKFPDWTFVAVEPSPGMVTAATRRAVANGYADRCTFHTGYLETLRVSERFDCATALLVSQFILNEGERIRFFSEIADRLVPGGLLASSDLASDVSSATYANLLELWLRTMSAADVPPERVQHAREAYARDVAILPAARIQSLISAAGFTMPVQFYQAGLIHAFYCRRIPYSEKA
jgi:tRNA (cmo5U34)-methyltransferase